MPPQFTTTSLNDILVSQSIYRKNEAEKQARRDDEEARRIIQESGGDVPASVDALRRRGLVGVADKLEKSYFDSRKSQADTMDRELQNKRSIAEEIAKVLGSVTNEATFQAARARVLKNWGPEAADEMGSSYNKATIDMMIAEGTSMQDQLRAKERAAELVRNAPIEKLKQRNAIAQMFAAADDEDDWQATRQWLKGSGIGDADLAWVPPNFSPEAKAQMHEASLTSEQKEARRSREADDKRLEAAATALAADREADNAETKRYHDALIRQGDARIGQGDRREDRLSTPDATTPGGNADATTRRQASTWLANQRRTLSSRARGTSTTKPLTQHELDAENEQIDAEYARMINAPPPADDAALPRGVKAYVRDLRKKYTKFEAADAELTQAMESLFNDHPNMDEAAVRRYLASAYNREPTRNTRQVQAMRKDPRTTPQPPQQPQSREQKKSALKVGAFVNGKDGKQYEVTKVYPDGSFEVKNPPGSR